ncbi:type IV pilus biogenesis protein PilP [Komagataeibacter rhaeticus]|uniref:type IV pilus biogenesis protein PilP n=1 Tax=Komagataeibacter rhaeticus TaxID=215221 RepID=UPI001CD211A5|nr:type IV pilus biogenesis protein PilP [Komagataeibacter rhaeticus]
MKRTLLAASMMAALPATCPAADIPLPSCALHLAQPPVGGVLTEEQIDTNNACILTMQQETSVAEAAAKIEEANRRASGKQEKASVAAPVAYPAVASRVMAPPQPAMPQHHMDAPTPQAAKAATPVAAPPPPPQPPVVTGIMWDGATYSADLIFPDGGSMEVRRGTTLPDGSSVVIVSQGGVYTQADGTIRPLRFESGETPAPAASSTPARHPVPSPPPVSSVPSIPPSYPVMH